MPQTRYYTDAYSPISYNVLYDQAGKGNFVQFDWTDMFQSLSLKKNGTGPGLSGTLNLFDYNDADPTRSFLIGPNHPTLNSIFKIQWWWANDPATRQNAPIYPIKCNTIHANYTPTGSGLAINFIMSGADAATLNKQALANNKKLPRTFQAGQLYSDIVQSICGALTAAGVVGWTVAYIEPTVGTLEHALTMGAESYEEFIIQKIIPLSTNANKDKFSFYRDYQNAPGQPVPDVGGIHFHSDSYLVLQGKASNGTNLAREYVGYADMAGEVESFTPSEDNFWALIMGGGDVAFSSIDSLDGVPVVQLGTVEGGVITPPPTGKTTANSSPGPTGSPPVVEGAQWVTNMRPGGGSVPIISSHIGLVAITPQEANHLATVQWATLAGKSYKATLVVHGTHNVTINDYIKVSYFTHGNILSYLSGVFEVVELQQDLGSAGWKTTMQMYRIGAGFDEAVAQAKRLPANGTVLQLGPSGQ